MFDGMLDEAKAMMSAMLEDEEFFNVMAKLYKAMFEALIKAGFNEQQALMIVAHSGKVTGGNK